MSKYCVTFETTIWYLWELRLSRECPVREATPSDASGVVSRLATTINKCLALESNCETQTVFVVHYHNSDTRAEKATKGYGLQNEEELPVAMVRKKNLGQPGLVGSTAVKCRQGRKTVLRRS